MSLHESKVVKRMQNCNSSANKNNARCKTFVGLASLLCSFNVPQWFNELHSFQLVLSLSNKRPFKFVFVNKRPDWVTIRIQIGAPLLVSAPYSNERRYFPLVIALVGYILAQSLNYYAPWVHSSSENPNGRNDRRENNQIQDTCWRKDWVHADTLQVLFIT